MPLGVLSDGAAREFLALGRAEARLRRGRAAAGEIGCVAAAEIADSRGAGRRSEAAARGYASTRGCPSRRRAFDPRRLERS